MVAVALSDACLTHESALSPPPDASCMYPEGFMGVDESSATLPASRAPFCMQQGRRENGRGGGRVGRKQGCRKYGLAGLRTSIHRRLRKFMHSLFECHQKTAQEEGR